MDDWGDTPLKKQDRVQHRRFVAMLKATTPRLYSTYALLAANVIVFFWLVLEGVSGIFPERDDLIQWGGRYGPAIEAGEWWRLLTCGFVHFGIRHLIMNGIVLFLYGSLVERLYGNVRLILGFVFSVLAGSLLGQWFAPDVVAVGASGGTFGLFGMLIVFLTKAGRTIPEHISKPHISGALLSVAVFLVWGWAAPGIDNVAHIGGLLGGALAGLVLYRDLTPLQNAADPASHGV